MLTDEAAAEVLKVDRGVMEETVPTMIDSRADGL